MKNATAKNREQRKGIEFFNGATEIPSNEKGDL